VKSPMAKIHLTIFIAAPVERVFNLSRSITLHKISAAATREQAIAGITSGLINLNETVTWQARHLLKQRKHTSKITAMEAPLNFVDEMIKGDFKSFKHEHYFKPVNNGTIMIDILNFESPLGPIGKLFNRIYLRKYLQRFLEKRNDVIKDYAETKKWKTILT
jgi:ligand-binding SRPBCC domain-containing protein